MNLLLLSSSRVADTGYLQHALSAISLHLQSGQQPIDEVLFIPYAGVTVSFDDYHTMVANAFEQIKVKVKSIHHFSEPQKAVADAKAIVVGGGNTFCLLDRLYRNQLIEAIGLRVRQGVPYIGWSAGSNIAAPSVKTTNDMPIIEPPSFNALNLLPFQINPHYLDGNPPGHKGETREQRLTEFLTINPQQTVVGLPEGTGLKLSAGRLSFWGEKSGYLFTKSQGKQSIQANADLSYLLEPASR